MKRLLLFCTMALAIFTTSFNSLAGGLIVVNDVRILPHPRPPIIQPPIRPPRPWPVPRPRIYRFAPMEVQEQKVNIKVTDQIAETTVKQVFTTPIAAGSRVISFSPSLRERCSRISAWISTAR